MEYDVLVGSTNQGKVDAAREAATEWFKAPPQRCAGMPGCLSGVSDQPVGLQETAQGAYNRIVYMIQKRKMENAQQQEKGKKKRLLVLISLESGVEFLLGAALDVCASGVAILDQNNDENDYNDRSKIFVGFSSAFPLPSSIGGPFSNKIHSLYLQYNDAITAAGLPTDANGKGLLSTLSSGRLSRPQQSKTSIEMALLQATNSTMYPSSPFVDMNTQFNPQTKGQRKNQKKRQKGKKSVPTAVKQKTTQTNQVVVTKKKKKKKKKSTALPSPIAASLKKKERKATTPS